jgi:NAD(P)-dependent dehydrogenase (short-subunit alcohol dehydrogenase family)
MNLGLENKVVILVGGAGGIGSATARLLAQEGAKVVVVDIKREEGEKLINSLSEKRREAIFIKADVTKKEEVARMVKKVLKKYQRIDILIHSVLDVKGGDILDIDEEIFQHDLDTHLKSAYLCIKEVLPQMISQRKGVIVNLSSVNSILGIGEVAYSAAKAGLNSLTQTTAVRYGPLGIRANALVLGTIDTEGAWGKRKAKDPQVLEKIAKRIPRKRVGTPEEVANLICFLASERSSLLNGATIVADGGWSIAAGTIKEGPGEWYE